MGEIFVQRDEDHRVVGLSIHDVPSDTVVGTVVFQFLRAIATALTEYLYVPVVFGAPNEFEFEVDRSDPHLDRELDAVLEMLVIGLRMLERDHPTELVVHEATVGVEV